MSSWGRAFLIVGSGKRDGEQDGRMGDVIRKKVRLIEEKEQECIPCTILYNERIWT